MSSQYEVLRGNIADFLIFLSGWFSLNTSYNHAPHLASQFRLDPEDHEIVSPLVPPPSCHLIMPAGCRITSGRPLIAPPSCRLVAPTGCCIASHCHLVVPPSGPLVAPTCCHIASPCPLVAPPTCPFVVLTGCCIASQSVALMISRHLVMQPLIVLLHQHQLVVASSSLVVLSCTSLLSFHCAGWLLCCPSLRCLQGVASPLVILLLHHPLVVLFFVLVHCLLLSSLCTTLLSSRRASLLSHFLSSPSCCPSPCPLVLSLCRLVVALPLDASPSCCLVVSSCRLSLSCCASWMLHHHLSLSSRCTALSSSHCAGWLLRCLSLRHPLVLPFNAVERCCRHRTPPPPPSLKAIRNVQLPQLLSIATVKSKRPPSSITAIKR